MSSLAALIPALLGFISGMLIVYGFDTREAKKTRYLSFSGSVIICTATTLTYYFKVISGVQFGIFIVCMLVPISAALHDYFDNRKAAKTKTVK